MLEELVTALRGDGCAWAIALPAEQPTAFYMRRGWRASSITVCEGVPASEVPLGCHRRPPTTWATVELVAMEPATSKHEIVQPNGQPDDCERGLPAREAARSAVGAVRSRQRWLG
jgi:hypothetical protein